MIDRIPKNIYKERYFSLCAPLIKINGEYHIVFEVRSNTIKQAGEVCFPGGHVEKGEAIMDAAIRECKEELLIEDENIEVLMPLDYYHGHNQAIAYLYLVELKNYEYTYNTDEVQEVFTVPVSYFMNADPDVYYQTIELVPEDTFPFEMIQRFEPYQWPTGKTDFVFYEYDTHLIWGLTARLLYHNLSNIKDYIEKGC